MVDRSRGHSTPRFELGPVKCYNALDRRAVELMVCYGLSPRTEQLQSVIVTQKPAVLCDTLVTHSQQGWCRSRGKSLRSTDQLLNGRLTSATAESNTVLRKRAPATPHLLVLMAPSHRHDFSNRFIGASQGACILCTLVEGTQGTTPCASTSKYLRLGPKLLA